MRRCSYLPDHDPNPRFSALGDDVVLMVGLEIFGNNLAPPLCQNREDGARSSSRGGSKEERILDSDSQDCW